MLIKTTGLYRHIQRRLTIYLIQMFKTDIETQKTYSIRYYWIHSINLNKIYAVYKR